MQNIEAMRTEVPSIPRHDPDIGPWTGPVSEFSDFADLVWRFEHEVPGYGDVILNWDVEPPEESALEPHEWPDLLQEGKRLLWSLTAFNARGKNIKGCNLGDFYVPLMYLLRWMAENDTATTADLVPEQAAEYLLHLKRTIGKGSREARQKGTVTRYADVVIRIHEQREWVFHGRDVHLADHPFEGRKASEEAAAIASDEKGWIPPVPDEVWSPVVARALEWLDEPATHVVKAAWALSTLHRRGHHLAPDGGDIAEALRSEHRGRHTLDWFVGMAMAEGRGLTVDVAATNRVLWRTFRSLHLDLRDACTIVIQAMLGLRVSEVAGLSAVRRKGDVWPACIQVRRSRSGLTEVFFLKGHLFKGQEKPLATEWVAGSRPWGTDHVPPAVRAVVMLHGLFRPWRPDKDRYRLIETLHLNLRGAIKVRVSAIRSEYIGAGQRRFVRRHVELPAARRGYRLSTHQWRKSFAIHMARMDERLLGAVSEHFKHLSIAMTEQGYVGRDPELMDLINDEGVRLAVEMLHRAARDRTPMAGRMVDTLRSRASGIIDACGVDGNGTAVERLADLVREEDIRVWPSPWGHCLFRPEVARCHRDAKGAFDLSARQPAYGFRHPGLCCDCSNLIVDQTHEEFWRGRHAENEAVLKACTQNADELGARVAEERVRTSASYLVQIEKAVAALKGNDHAA